MDKKSAGKFSYERFFVEAYRISSDKRKCFIEIKGRNIFFGSIIHDHGQQFQK